MEETTENKKKRRRKPCPSEWAQNKRAADVQKRKFHVSEKGKQTPEKVVNLEDCECTFLCRHAITVEQQTTLFEEYYSLESHAG